MPQCVIIADDLTGANATGVLLTKQDFQTTTVMNIEDMSIQSLNQYDAITYPTDSRAIDSGEAYRRVFEAVSRLRRPDIQLYNKRIDSTLRGNLGAEIDGMLDGLGEDRIAVVVPCFPQAGRIAVGGYLLVNGVMLQETDAARDPKTPIHTSVIETLIKKQTRYQVKSIFIDTVYSGVKAIKEAMLQAVQEGSRVLVFDAVQVKDLELIADALLQSELAFITVDPGPFTATVAQKMLKPRKILTHKKVLMSIGSVTHLTKTQIEEIIHTYNPIVEYIETEKLIYNEKDREAEIRRVVEMIINQKDQADLFGVIVKSVNPEYRLDLTKIAQKLQTTEEELSKRINDSIAEISSRILQTDSAFQGIFSSGGDITVALCQRFKATGMELLREIIPLAAYGTLVGGINSGLKIVTKGGMVGDQDGMKQCVQFLREHL